MTHLRPERHGLYDPANEHDACGVGFVAHVKGVASHQTVLDAASMLECMDHRGAYGCEMNTAMVLGCLLACQTALCVGLPRNRLLLSFRYPAVIRWAMHFYLPMKLWRQPAEDAFAEHLAAADLGLIGWREVHDANRANLGPTALRSMPRIEQIFVSAAEGQDELTFERTLYGTQTGLRRACPKHQFSGAEFYVCSLLRVSSFTRECWLHFRLPPFIQTCATMITNPILRWFTSFLGRIPSHLGNVLNQNRMMAHNGEINTLRGNVNWMHAREGF